MLLSKCYVLEILYYVSIVPSLDLHFRGRHDATDLEGVVVDVPEAVGAEVKLLQLVHPSGQLQHSRPVKLVPVQDQLKQSQ